MKPLRFAIAAHGSSSIRTASIVKAPGFPGITPLIRTADGGETSVSSGSRHDSASESLANGWTKAAQLSAPLAAGPATSLVNGVALTMSGYGLVVPAELKQVGLGKDVFRKDDLVTPALPNTSTRRRKLKVYKRMLSNGKLADCVQLLEELFATTGPIKSIEVNCSSFLNACKEKASVGEALRFLQLLEQPSLNLFNSVMSICTSLGDTDGAQRVMVAVRRAGLKGDCALHTNLINCFCKAGRLDMAFKLYHEMEAAGVEPSVNTFSVMITGCAKANQVSKAFGVYGIALSKGVKADLVLYNTLITACGRAGTLERAFDVLRDMQEESVLANSHTMCALIDACTRAGEPGRAMEVYRLLQSKNITTSLAVYTSAVHSCSIHGDMDVALAVFEDLKAAGVAPDEIFFSALMDVAGKARQVEAAFEIFDEMRSMGLEAKSVSYGGLMGACCKAACTDKALEVYSEMKSRGIEQNVQGFNALIHALVDESQLDSALGILEEMRGVDVAPNDITFNILLNACWKLDAPEVAFELYAQAQAQGLPLTLNMCSSMIRVCFFQIQAGRPPLRQFFLGRPRLWESCSTKSSQEQWSSVAMCIYRDTIAAGVMPDPHTLSHLLACLKLPDLRMDVDETIFAPLGVAAGSPLASATWRNQSRGKRPPALSDGGGVYSPQAVALYEEATAMGIVPRLCLLSGMHEVSMETMPPSVAEVCVLAILKGLKRRRAADPETPMPTVGLRFPVEKHLVLLNGVDKTKQIVLVSRTGQAVVNILRRLRISHHGHESTGHIRVMASALSTYFRRSTGVDFEPPMRNLPGSRQLGQGIALQQRNIRTGELSSPKYGAHYDSDSGDEGLVEDSIWGTQYTEEEPKRVSHKFAKRPSIGWY